MHMCNAYLFVQRVTRNAIVTLRNDRDIAKEDLIEIVGVLCSITVDRGKRTYLNGGAEIC